MPLTKANSGKLGYAVSDNVVKTPPPFIVAINPFPVPGYFTPLVAKVLTPANVCAPVVTTPLEPVPASGTFNVITGCDSPLITVLDKSVSTADVSVNAATDVTEPPPVPAPIAVLNDAASNHETVLFALACKNVIADGFVDVNIFPPTVVAPRDVLPVAEVPEFARVLPSHLNLSLYAVSQLVLL